MMTLLARLPPESPEEGGGYRGAVDFFRRRADADGRPKMEKMTIDGRAGTPAAARDSRAA